MNNGLFDEIPGDAPVLVAVVNNPADLLRARSEGWYRIPFVHAPDQIGADFVAFYQTAAFPPEERWTVRWIAPVRGYHLATRRDLIPEEADHPRADAYYYRVSLGELVALPHPVPSRRLRRVTFIRTTLERLLGAHEINDLWLHTPRQERLWQALQQAGFADEIEHDYPLVDDLPYTASLAVLGEAERVALVLAGDQAPGKSTREGLSFDYLLARGGWHGIRVDAGDANSIAICIEHLKELGLARAQRHSSRTTNPEQECDVLRVRAAKASRMIDFDQIIDRRGTDSVKWQWYGDAIPMWVADMDFPAAEPIIQALTERVRHGVFGYANEPQELREVLQAWLLRRFNWQVPAESLVFMPGVVSAFNVACRAYCAPGDGVLVQSPVYPPMRTAPANFDLTRDEMELTRGGNGRYEIDYDLMNATITDRTRLFLLSNPHNPTGRVFTREELGRMAEVSLSRGLVVCSDEIHCDLIYSPYQHLPIASLDPEIARRSVTLMAPSKTFNIPGLGFSFAIIEDRDLRKQYKAAARDIVPHINALGYTAALAAYTKGEPWLEACIEYLQGNRDYLAQFVAERMAGVRMALPEATYLAWLDFSGAGLGEEPHKCFLERAGVALNEAAPFGPGSEGFGRLNFACPRSLLTEALERMERAMARA